MFTYVCDSCGAQFVGNRRFLVIRCWGGGPDGNAPGHIGLGPVMRLVDPDYPKFKSLDLDPDMFKGWIVTLTTGRHRVALGNLKEWLNKYAR